MNILAFESSCDETAAAVVRDGRTVLSDVIASQADMHAVYGGVVPEIASRKHVEAIAGLADQALARACLLYTSWALPICAAWGARPCAPSTGARERTGRPSASWATPLRCSSCSERG